MARLSNPNFKYHDCEFCQSMVVDYQNDHEEAGASLRHHEFLFSPTLASVLAAAEGDNYCPFAQFLINDWSTMAKRKQRDSFFHFLDAWSGVRYRSTAVRLYGHKSESPPRIQIGLCELREDIHGKNGLRTFHDVYDWSSCKALVLLALEGQRLSVLTYLHTQKGEGKKERKKKK